MNLGHAATCTCDVVCKGLACRYCLWLASIAGNHRCPLEAEVSLGQAPPLGRLELELEDPSS